MNPRLGFALLAGFGALIVLTAILGVSQNRRAAQIRQELTAAQEAYSATEVVQKRSLASQLPSQPAAEKNNLHN